MNIIPNTAELDILNILSNAWAGGLNVNLYKNNYTPDSSTAFVNMTVANFTGYAAALATGFSTPTTISGKASINFGGAGFTCTGGGIPNDIYGYYVDYSGTLLWAERFADAPVTIDESGDTLNVSLNFTLSSEN